MDELQPAPNCIFLRKKIYVITEFYVKWQTVHRYYMSSILASPKIVPLSESHQPLPGIATAAPGDKTSLTTPYFRFTQPVVPLLPSLSSFQENDQ